jgi:hypothetical protein
MIRSGEHNHKFHLTYYTTGTSTRYVLDSTTASGGCGSYLKVWERRRQADDTCMVP